MTSLSQLAYAIDPALWVKRTIGAVPTDWQVEFLRAPRGASLAVLTARQIGKTTVAAWAIAHFMVYHPGSLSVVACPAQRQSAYAIRLVKETLLNLGLKLKVDNVYVLELENGSRVMGLPGSDDSIRGLTVDGWIIADEAARITEDLMAALRPMRARRPHARLALLSTAWSRTDPFWTAWADEEGSWIKLRATADAPGLFDPAFLEQERRGLGEVRFNREYLGIPGGDGVSPFGWDLYERATQIHTPLLPGGPAMRPKPERAQPMPNPFQSFRVPGAFQ
jgi:hypothetical protein